MGKASVAYGVRLFQRIQMGGLTAAAELLDEIAKGAKRGDTPAVTLIHYTDLQPKTVHSGPIAVCTTPHGADIPDAAAVAQAILFHCSRIVSTRAQPLPSLTVDTSSNFSHITMRMPHGQDPEIVRQFVRSIMATVTKQLPGLIHDRFDITIHS